MHLSLGSCFLYEFNNHVFACAVIMVQAHTQPGVHSLHADVYTDINNNQIMNALKSDKINFSSQGIAIEKTGTNFH